jgi:hypothetical protein
MRYGRAISAERRQYPFQSVRKPAKILVNSFEALGKPCASIDAELRDWDVLLGFHYPLLPGKPDPERDVILWL